MSPPQQALFISNMGPLKQSSRHDSSFQNTSQVFRYSAGRSRERTLSPLGSDQEQHAKVLKDSLVSSLETSPKEVKEKAKVEKTGPVELTPTQLEAQAAVKIRINKALKALMVRHYTPG